MFKVVRQWERWQEIGSEMVQPWQQFETNLSVFLVSERSQIGIEMYTITFSHQLDNKALGHKDKPTGRLLDTLLDLCTWDPFVGIRGSPTILLFIGCAQTDETLHP